MHLKLNDCSGFTDHFPMKTNLLDGSFKFSNYHKIIQTGKMKENIKIS